MSRPGERTGPAGWAQTPEIGSGRAVQWLSAAYRKFGGAFLRPFVWPSVGYFLLVNRKIRSASLDYLRTLAALPAGARLVGSRPGLYTVLRHFVSFGHNVLDRLELFAGGEIDIRYKGDEHLRALQEAGRGGILLGAHVGSFDMMRVLASRYSLPVNVVMFTKHAERINELFKRMDPSSAVRVIEIEPGSLRTAFAIRACLERGEFVGILGDRTGLFPGEAPVSVPFLGRRASLPRAPFRMAIVLQRPVLTAICLRTADGSYEVEVAPLFDGKRVPREQRAARTERMAAQFAERLEEACLTEPLQWFNFYPYFDPDEPNAGRPPG